MNEENKKYEDDGFEEAHIEFSDPENISIPETPSEKKKNKKIFTWSIIIFILIILLSSGGYWIWNSYFSETAIYRKQSEENYNKYLDWKDQYETAMTEDTYGGPTPEETLNMFIEALEKNNLELASKYFVLNEAGERDPEILNNLKNKTIEEIQNIIALLKTAKPVEGWSEELFGFEIRENGKIIYDINLILNTYSNTWKIESL